MGAAPSREPGCDDRPTCRGWAKMLPPAACTRSARRREPSTCSSVWSPGVSRRGTTRCSRPSSPRGRTTPPRHRFGHVSGPMAPASWRRMPCSTVSGSRKACCIRCPNIGPSRAGARKSFDSPSACAARPKTCARCGRIAPGSQTDRSRSDHTAMTVRIRVAAAKRDAVGTSAVWDTPPAVTNPRPQDPQSKAVPHVAPGWNTRVGWDFWNALKPGPRPRQNTPDAAGLARERGPPFRCPAVPRAPPRG